MTYFDQFILAFSFSQLSPYSVFKVKATLSEEAMMFLLFCSAFPEEVNFLKERFCS